MTAQKSESGSRSRLIIIGATAAISWMTLARDAHAFQDESTRCFATAPTWNAAKGMLVSAASAGPVAAVVGALGESRTHVMLSNGDWATESTTRVPTLQTVTTSTAFGLIHITLPNATQPLNPVELAAGSPGFSQINMGGAFAYWSNAPQVWRQTAIRDIVPGDPTLCGRLCKAEGTADWLWSESPYATVATLNNSFYYSLGTINADDDSYVHISYGFHQYMNGLDRMLGGGAESPGARGIECAQVPAYGYTNFLDAHSPKITPGSAQLAAHTYTHDETASAGNALWNSVYNSCMGTDPGFWGKLGSSLIALGTGIDIQGTTCNHAAWQVLNCFFSGEDPNGGGCVDSTSTRWNAYVPAENVAGAISVSPDGILGIGPRATTALNVGPWAGWAQSALQWNGGGSTYGCFY